MARASTAILGRAIRVTFLHLTSLLQIVKPTIDRLTDTFFSQDRSVSAIQLVLHLSMKLTLRVGEGGATQMRSPTPLVTRSARGPLSLSTLMWVFSRQFVLIRLPS